MSDITLDTHIDPTEVILALIGVRPLILRNVEYFTKAQLEQVSRYKAKIIDLARKLCDDNLDKFPLFETDYDETLKELYQDWTPTELEKLTASLAENAPGIDVAFQAKAKSVIDYLRSIFPRQQVGTFLIAVNVVPSDPAIYAFESVLEVLENPLRAFPLMAAGAITKRQIQAVRQVYPTISEAIDEALIDVASSKKAQTKSFELSPTAEIGASKWIGKPAIDPKTAQQIKAAAPKATPSQGKPAAKTPKGSVLAKESLSSAQKATLGPDTLK